MHNLGPFIAAVPLTIVFSVWAFEIAFVSAKAIVRQRRKRED
jgi:hypothetical protein